MSWRRSAWPACGNRVRIIVGGAPITAKYATQIGADGYAPDAPKAVRKVRELLTV